MLGERRLVEIAGHRDSRLFAPKAIAIFAAASLTIILFGLTPVTTRIAGEQIDGMSIGLIRSLGAGLFAVPLILIGHIGGPRDPTGWALLLISSLGSFAAFPILFSLGAQLTSASHAGLMMASMPLITCTLGLIIDRRKPQATWYIGAIFALAGEVALVTMSDHGADTPASIMGDCLVLGSCVSCACGFAAGGRLASRISPLAATLWAIVIAALVLSPWSAIALVAIDWASLEPASWAALAHITVGASIVGYVCWFWALSQGGIARVAPFQFAQPVVVLLFAVMLLGEHLASHVVAASIAIVGGIMIARRGYGAAVR